ncbi:bifunctional riboflavin kinase/FAD synthetase [Rhodospirillaceae bacterium SYSU D60014]|uniref:bifunctional riboflavin kinase/FAD synthetase n=1 Tax=Virgifigura deserti TaxID=2268457 RepID=UPI000E6688FE
MRLFRHYSEVPVEARGAVVALGNFDGVHRGHQAVIGEAARLAREARAPLAVLTFEPHPREFFQPDQPPFRLTPFRIKVRQLETIGVDYLFVLHFDAELARKSAEAFVVEVLGEGLEAAHIVVGYDFVFGHQRRGNAALLRDLAGPQGVGVTSVEPVTSESGEVFSSTRIREHLRAGQPLKAGILLGRPWEIEGRVEHGDARGRLLGFPTANLALGDYMQPALGVYAVKAGIDEGRGTVWRDGVANLGRRPTVGGERVQLEVHLFDFAGDLYGRHLRVALIDFLRGEKKFDGLESLKAQIAADTEEARRLMAAYTGPAPGAAPSRPKIPEDRFIRPGVYEGALRPRTKSRN